MPLSAAGVAAMVVHMVRDQIMGEWRRVTEDITDMRGVCKSWYRGRSVRLDRDEFVQRWCIGGMLCTVSNGVMSLKFSKTSPSRIPI